MFPSKKGIFIKTFEISVGFIQSFFSKGHQRSLKAKKHIFISFITKGLSVLIGFATVPITLGYINKEQYGIWLTLSSIVAWLDFFDIGLGHGLRNKLAESLAINDKLEAKIYVSSTYSFLSIIFILIIIVFLIINPLINWHLLLNISPDQLKEINLIVALSVCFFCVNVVLKLIHTILFADQRPSIPGLLNLISNAISLLVIVILTMTTKGSLLYLAVSLGLTPILILALTSFIFFNSKYKEISPSIKYIRLTYFNKLIGLGFRFFILGISSLIIFSTDNIIISHIFGPSEVPTYAISHKFFSLITILFAIIGVPFWSAYTEAFLKNDIKWIIGTNKTLIKIWFLFTIISIMMLIFSESFYHMWVPEIDIPFKLSFFMCLYVNMLAFGNIFIWFLNGVGKVQLQTVGSIIGALFNIPLSYFFAKTCGLGPSGVILASMICIVHGSILAPIQFKKIVNGNASGIWNK